MNLQVFRAIGGFFGRPIIPVTPTIDRELVVHERVATADPRPTIDTHQEPTMHSMIYGSSPGRAELIHEHQQKILAAERRQQRTGDQGPMTPGQMNARARAHYRANDVMLTIPSEGELRASVTSRVDSGKVWSGDEGAMLSALQSLPRDQRQAAFDELSNGGDPAAIAERYLGGGTSWRVAGNGGAYTAANEAASKNEQGTPPGTRDVLAHLDADFRRGVSLIAGMQLNNVRSRRSHNR